MQKIPLLLTTSMLKGPGLGSVETFLDNEDHGMSMAHFFGQPPRNTFRSLPQEDITTVTKTLGQSTVLRYSSLPPSAAGSSLAAGVAEFGVGSLQELNSKCCTDSCFRSAPQPYLPLHDPKTNQHTTEPHIPL